MKADKYEENHRKQKKIVIQQFRDSVPDIRPVIQNEYFNGKNHQWKENGHFEAPRKYVVPLSPPARHFLFTCFIRIHKGDFK